MLVLLATRKKPRPWISRSSGLPVDWAEPGPIRLSIEPTIAPRPTSIGFVPPLFDVGPEAPRITWESSSTNVVR